MSVYCHVVVKPGATAGQLAALGTALWAWCTGAANGDGVYQYLDNQGLADLIAGRLPAADPSVRPADRWGVRFRVPDGAFPDRRAVVESLTRALPAAAVEAVRADGVSRAGAGPKIVPASPS